MRVVTLTTEVTPERTLTIHVPQDIPAGPAQVVVVFVSEPQTYRTLGDLRLSEFFGMWRDRTDLPESPALARILREQAWERSPQ
jgi:hypothetical protein